MNVRRLFKRLSSVPALLSSYRSRNVYLIAEQEDWILDWIGFYIKRTLQNRYGISVCEDGNIKDVRNQIMHFINRFRYLRGEFRTLHPSNHCFLNWFHGDPYSSDPNSKRLFQALLEAVPSTEKIIVSCQLTKQSLLDVGIEEEKLVTIPLGVDLAHFVAPSPEERSAIRTRLGISEQAYCIGLFQKDGEGKGDGDEPKLRKGPDVFLEVIQALSHRHKNLFVLLTGPARGYVKQGLEKMSIPFLHQQLPNYYDIIPYYHALDLYIIPARFEGGPASLLESWATGVPIVSTQVGMPADLIKHGENGLLTEVEDAAQLAEYATAFIEDAALRDRCRRRAIEDVKYYDWPLIAKHYYQKLYQPLLT